jgi:hypothetical protein
MKQWITPFLALGAMFLLTACGMSNSSIISNGLRIALTKIERTAGGSYEITWELQNPNVVAYVVDRSEHKIYLDDVLVGTVSKKTRQGVPLQERAVGTDSLTVASPAAGEKLTQALAQSPLPYRVESTIWVLLADDEISKSSLSSSGTVSVTAK